jgi:glyoxylase-like metal-dependent hydrolase (beta-lactamase superfamily II)
MPIPPVICRRGAARLSPMKASIPTPSLAPPPAAGGAATQVSLIPVLRDNYVFVIEVPASGPVSGQAVVVDPAVAAPVIAWLEGRNLELVALLHTHHHSDHIGGAGERVRRWPAACNCPCPPTTMTRPTS